MKRQKLSVTTQEVDYQKAYEYVQRYTSALYYSLQEKKGIDHTQKKDIKKRILDSLMNSIAVSWQKRTAIRNHIKHISKEEIKQIDQESLEELEQRIKALHTLKEHEAEIARIKSNEERYELLIGVLHTSSQPQEIIQQLLYSKQKQEFIASFPGYEDYKNWRGLQPDERKENNPL